MIRTHKCCAKINLSLDILRKRPDGYHDVEMIMHTVGIYDLLTVSLDPLGTGIDIRCRHPLVPESSDNIAFKAARKFLDEAGLDAEITIDIKKNIPVGAGLGGGSSDAAGVLCCLNGMLGSPLTKEQLYGIAVQIGSDVPFFLMDSCMLATGTGTTLTPLKPLEKGVTVIAKPPVFVSTAQVYKNFDLTRVKKHPDTKKCIEALEKQDLKKLSEYSGNVLETVTAAMHGEIEEYKAVMKNCGAVYSMMSGSGPSVFGIFDNEAAAFRAARELKKRTDEVFVAERVQV